MSEAKILRTLAKPGQAEIIIQKSRFIGQAHRVQSPDEAMDTLKQVSDSDATHNCWAYRIGGLYRFSDDGEPGGTAGRPMLTTLDGTGLDEVLVVVTRYFGGIKLGTGGLVRAYSQAVRVCLEAAEILEIHPKTELRCLVPFDSTSIYYHLLNQVDATVVSETYNNEGMEVCLEILLSQEQAFRDSLVDASNGTIRLLP